MSKPFLEAPFLTSPAFLARSPEHQTALKAMLQSWDANAALRQKEKDSQQERQAANQPASVSWGIFASRLC
jgi:hypothetical protein